MSLVQTTLTFMLCVRNRADFGGGGTGRTVGVLSAEKRSVSDYMGGHHAGKFDFDERISGVTSLNYEKSVVFDQTAEPGGTVLASVTSSEIPAWATRPVDAASSAAQRGTIWVGEAATGADGGASVTVKNDELSWEPFYARIEIAGREVSPKELGMHVYPESGNLAPRGGANNACDESKPYSDSAILTLSLASDVQRPVSSDTPSDPSPENNNVFLVVRTEQNHWCWRIVM